MSEEYIKKSEIEDKIDEAYEDLDGYDPDSLGVFYSRVNEILYGVPAYTMPEVASSGEYIRKADMERILYSTNNAVRIGEEFLELPTYSMPDIEKIRAEIDEQYDIVRPYNIDVAEGLEMALEIIEKYKGDKEC